MESQAILSKFWVYKKFLLMRFIVIPTMFTKRPEVAANFEGKYP